VNPTPPAAGRVRRSLKLAVFALCLVVAAPLVLSAWVEKRLTRTEGWFALLSQTLAIVPGFVGRWLRGAYYYGTLDRCSWETHIGFGSLFTHRAVSLGSRVSIGAYCVIGHARIQDDVRMGSRVSIPSGKRQHLNDEGRLADLTRFDPVTVGSHTWLGEGAIVMADIGSGCIVAAGAVVSQPMPDGSLIGGNPARVIRKLDRDDRGAPLD